MSRKTIIGVLSVWLLTLAITAWAQPNPQDLAPTNRGFANPFLSPGSSEDDRDEDEPPPSRSAVRVQPPSPRSITLGTRGGAKGADDVPDPKMGRSGIEIGGETGNGIVSGSKVNSIPVDTESGKGGKEIVTDFNFPDADIMDIAKTLGKLTGKNFILDNDVKGRIKIISNSPITVGDAWRAFLTALDINGFTIIPSGEYLRIARQRDARDKQLSLYMDDSPSTDQLITRVFQLRHISAEEVERAFRSFIPATARIVPYAQTNTVIVTDTGHNIQKLAKMLDVLDVESHDAGIEVVQVRYASAVELSKLIETLLPGGNARLGARPGAPRFNPSVPGTQTQPRRTKEGGIINAIIADERTNTLIVHANQKGVEQVQALVAKLDKRLTTAQGGGKIHVLYLQFADSEEIAKTLNNLQQSSGGSTQRPSSNTQGGLGVNPTESTLFEGQIKVSPDKATNSLVIAASPTDFSTVQRVVARLDVPRDEVYVEAVIMEMTMAKNFDFATNFALPNRGLFMLPSTDLLSAITNPAAQKGFVFNFQDTNTTPISINGSTFNVGNVAALIKAIQTNTNANILATPQIMTLDNKEATFEAGEKIPTVSTSLSQGVSTQSVSRDSVGLSITIKPQINKVSNFVSLDIKTKLEDVQNRPLPKQVQDLALATTERKANTTVVVGDGDTVVIGGLMRDKVIDQDTKVPILGDIPLLGWLFRAKSSSVEKTNLMIFITPHIIKQYEKVRALLDKKLKERDDFLESQIGGEDKLRPYRDNIIRSLPDIKNFASKGPVVNEATRDADLDISEDQIPPRSRAETPAAVIPSAGTPAPATPPTAQTLAPPASEPLLDVPATAPAPEAVPTEPKP